MKELSVTELRNLIQLIAPLGALRTEVEKSIHLELYQGTADLAMRSYEGLRESAAQITQDPYVGALHLDVSAEMDDRVKMSQVLLAASQLLSYLAAQTGVSGLVGAENKTSIQTAPHIIINTSNTTDEHKSQVLDFIQQITKQDDNE